MQDKNTHRFGRYISCESNYQCGECGMYPYTEKCWFDDANTYRYCSPTCAESAEAHARGIPIITVRRQYITD